MKKTDLFKFLKSNPKFSKLWVSQLMSQITINMINFVMATRIYEKTGSTLAVSFLWVFYYLPSIIFGPFSGFLVDLWGRRKILYYTNFFQGLTVLLYLFIGEHLYPIYPIIFLYSILNLLYGPAEAACIPWLVKKKSLSFANSIFMLSSQSSLIVGFGISGVIMRLFGKDTPILISAGALFLAALSTYLLPKNEPKNHFKTQTLSNFFSQIKTGYLFIKDNKMVLFPILIIAGFQIFLVVMGVTIPTVASKLFGIQVQDAGPLIIVPLGIGALLGANLVSRYSGIRKKTFIEKGLLIGGLVFLMMTFVIPRLESYKTLFGFPLMILLGICSFFILVPNQTLLQENTPSSLRGRIFGALNFVSTAATLPCLLFTASVVDLVGIKVFMFMAFLLIVSVFIFVKKRGQAIIASITVNKDNGITNATTI